ncbi:MAG: hypothetical protein IKK53_00765 [Ruminiclostridium sp.]|nr:hypothetical protein [Ruminiclostridium sp.]
MSYEETKAREAKAQELKQYIGDFYEGHAANDREKQDAALKKIQTALFTGDSDSEPFKDYFNEVFSGRTAFNTLLSINDYPKESILRELLQNTFGCHYETKDIKVLLNFSTNQHQVSLSYNEVGFTMEQILYYLSFGRGERDSSGTREGRFGVGAKSVFLNVEWLSLKSNNFSFKIKNDNGNLKILELDLFGTQFKGTEIVFKVRGDEFNAIMENYLTLTDKRGDYMNLMELCFAFNRKKYMDTRTGKPEEATDRTFNIAVKVNDELKTIYKIMQYHKEGDKNPTIRFMQNNKSVIDFLCYENGGFSYLIPYAVANAKRAELVKLLCNKYNYFSTYELTGLYKENCEAFIDEHLSAFFISVPNDYITPHRTGIRHDSENEVTERIEKDLTEMVKAYRQYFVLAMQPVSEGSDKYFLFPKSYAFEFFKNFIQTSKFGKKIEGEFQNSLSVVFPGEAAPVPYEEIKETGFQSVAENVPAERHEDGTAYTEYITNALDTLREQIDEDGNKSLYVAYTWEKEEGVQGGREYLYEFTRNGNVIYVDSKASPNRSDNKLYYGFSSPAKKMAGAFLKDNVVHNETELEQLLAMYDEIYYEDYKIVMKYYQFYISHGEEQQHYEVSKMNIGNLKNAMDTIQKRQNRFDTHQNYNEVVSMIINTFTQGKDTMTFLKEIKEQGGKITLQLDINKRYRFSAYNKQFMIPPSVSNQEMLDLIGDAGMLIKCGMLDGRVFDFPHTKSRFAFDKNLLSEMFVSDTLTDEDIADRADKMYICDLKIDRVALIGENDKIIKIIEAGTEITPEWREKTQKYIALRGDYTKPEFADVAEYIITGEAGSRLSAHYLTAEEPNKVIPDQIPYYFKPLPTISKREFEYLRQQCRDIAQYRENRSYKNYFAKDVSGKLFGYGGSCSACGFESRVINSFELKDFEVEVLTAESEELFRFSLYLCANDAAAAGGWLISDVSIGGMSPVRWLEEISKADTIPPEFLFCHISYRTQITYDILGGDSKASGEVMFDTDRKELDITLTPLMAAKWVEDNKRDA